MRFSRDVYEASLFIYLLRNFIILFMRFLPPRQVAN